MADDTAPFGFGALPEYDALTGAIIPTEKQQGKFNRIADAVVGGLKQWVNTPGDRLWGTFAAEPEIPGKITEADVFREQQAARENATWGAGTAFGMIGAPGVPRGAVGSAARNPLFHGSERTNLEFLNPSDRGPLGPGLYTSEAPQIAKSYAGDAGRVYEMPNVERDIYMGKGHRTDAEWVGFKEDKARLVAAAEPEKRAELSGILDRMWSGDGYPTYQRVRSLYGNDEAAQNLFRKAGFEGVSGLVDGPETVLFGSRSHPILGAGSRDPAATAAGTVAQATRDAPLSISPGIRAYHGSPYDFEKFDGAKIGTGEGAQAYGHGLYFAENEGVARQYREALAGKAANPARNEELTRIALELRQYEVPGHYGKYNSPEGYALKERYNAIMDERAADKGRMYEVNIGAKPEQFLDWEKPLYQQGPQAADAFKNITKMELGPPTVEGGAPNAGQFIKSMGRMVGDERISQQLSEAGIPGIRYLDQGSRGPANWTGKPDAQATAKYKDQWESLVADRRKAAGENQRGDTAQVDAMMDAIHKKMMDETMARDPNAGRTSNYVVFDPSIIEIMRKYALPGAVGGGAAFGSLAPGDRQ